VPALITRKTAKVSTRNARVGIALVRRGTAKQGPAGTATVQREAGRTRLLAALLHGLSTWAV
jgi:hypothetical protein